MPNCVSKQLRYNFHLYGIILEVSSTWLVDNSHTWFLTFRTRMYATNIWVCSCGRPTEDLTLHMWARKRPTKGQRSVINLMCG